MKTIFNFLIIALIYTSKCSVYDWNVKTIERDPDFGDELKIQTALNNELQNDLMKISGKLDNKNQNDDIYFAKQYNFKNNDADTNRNIQDKYEYKFDGIYDDNIKDKINQNDENHKENSGRKHNLEDKQSDQNEEGNSDNYQYQHKSFNKDDVNFNRHNGLIHHQDQHIVSDYIGHKHNGKDDYEHNRKDSTDNKDHNHFNNNDSNSQNYHSYTNNYVSDNTDLHNNYDHKNRNKEHNTDAKNENNKGDQISNKTEEDKKKNNKEENYALISHCPAKAPDIENFVGTNLFDNMPKQCFSNEELALLNTRRDFESLLPKDLPQCLLNDRMLALLTNYFYTWHQLIIQMIPNGSKYLAEKAFYDALGGYLNFYLVPVAKYSYYGGHLSLNAVKNVLTLHQQCKKILNTNGNGWKSPLQNVLDELQTIRIEPLHTDDGEKGETSSFCMHLDMSMERNDPDDDKMIVPIPKLEAEDLNGYLGNIWLPFRRKKTFDLKSENSAYVVVKFYETVTKCYQFENIPQNYYNQKFKTWLLENIHIHLSDEQFYPGLGAVLRIYEYLKRGKKEVTSYGDDLDDLEYEDEGKTTMPRDTQERTRMYSKMEDTRKDHYQNDRNSKEFLDFLNKSKLKEKSKIWIDNNYHKESENNLNQFNQNSKKEEVDNSKENISNKPLKNDSLKDVELVARIESAHPTIDILNLRTLEFSPPKIAVISIPIVALILIVLICCYKCCFKKKKPVVQIKSTKVKKDSSSSSNLISSPVRFFYVKPKSETGKSTSGKSITSMSYSSEPTDRKVKKTVKIQKKAVKDRDNNDTDTSASSSPTKNKKKDKGKDKEKDKGKDKDRAKSSSKSSWETTYSSKSEQY